MSSITNLAPFAAGIDTKLKIMHAVDGPLESLSVKEICEKAGISRDTFYRHFSSKYDITIWHGKLVQAQHLDDAGRTLSLKTGYRRHFQLMSEEDRLYGVAFKNMGRSNNEFPEMNEHRKNVITKTLQEHRGVEVDDEMAFCIDAFVQLETMLTSRWLSDGCTPDPEVFASRIVSMIPNRLYDAWEL